MSDHPLVEFIYSTFGEPLGDLLLVGYASECAEQKTSFRFNAQRGDSNGTWMVDVTANEMPCRKEPLVLAALLKFLMLRIDLDDPGHVSSTFEFDMQKLLAEVGRDGTIITEEAADDIIEKYTKISYAIREMERKSAKARKIKRGGGYFTFLSGYRTLSYKDEGDDHYKRLVDRVTINGDFVEALKRGEITFAGLKLGERQLPQANTFSLCGLNL